MLDEKARVERALPGARAEAEKLQAPVNAAFAAYQALFPSLPEGAVARQGYLYADRKVKDAQARIAAAKRDYEPAYERVQRLRSWREGLAQRILEAEALIAQLEREEARKQADLDGPPASPPSFRQRVSDLVSALSPSEEQVEARRAAREARTDKALAARTAE
jgi:chromosome segregation ATPase